MKRSRVPFARLGFGLLLLCLGPASARAQSSAAIPASQAEDPALPDLTQLSLEQLAQAHISVSSFGRKDEDLWKTPAAVFVITREDIEHSSAPTIPALLRMVPGMQVAQLNASVWAVSARGFNSVFSDKLLVLVDGRTLFNEIYSGALWDQIDLPLDNIERIEVIRGPGAAVWGTNAANGVINIITRRVRDTQGLLVTATSSRVEGNALIRYGGTVGDRLQYLAYADYLNRLPFVLPSGAATFDGEDMLRGGLIVDWRKSASDTVTFDADLYGGHQKEQLVALVDLDVGPDHQEHESLAGGHLLGRWKHHSSGSDTELQVFFDDQSRHELGGYQRTLTFSADFQDHHLVSSRQDLVWGAGLRLTADHFNHPVAVNQPSDFHNYLLDAFAQDEIALIPQRLTLTLGSKIQNGTLAGFQLQPSARILYAPIPAVSLWAAVSRAVVAPSLQDTQLSVPVQLGSYQTLPVLGSIQGNPAYKSEEIIAYEVGARTRLSRKFAIDVAAFYNSNFRVQSLSVGAPVLIATPAPHLFAAITYTNWFQARSAGIETSLSFKPNRNLSFQTAYTWMESHTTPLSNGPMILVDEWSAPDHSVSESAAWSLSPRWTASLFLAYVGKLTPPFNVLVYPGNDGTSNLTPAYTRLDLRLERKLAHGLAIGGGGTNLLTGRHLEFGSETSFQVAAYVPRSGFVKVAWTF